MISSLNNNQAWFFLPAVAVGATCIASRVTAGSAGLLAKGASNLTNVVGPNIIGRHLDSAGNKLIAYATKSPKTELGLIFSLAVLGAGAYEISQLLPQNELSTMENLKRYVGITKSHTPLEYLASCWNEQPGLLTSIFSGAVGATIFASTVKTSPEAELEKVAISASNFSDLTQEIEDLSEIIQAPTDTSNSADTSNSTEDLPENEIEDQSFTNDFIKQESVEEIYLKFKLNPVETYTSVRKSIFDL